MCQLLLARIPSVHTRAYPCIPMYARAYLCMPVHTCACLCIPAHACASLCMSVHTCAYPCIPVHTGVYRCVLPQSAWFLGLVSLVSSAPSGFYTLSASFSAGFPEPGKEGFGLFYDIVFYLIFYVVQKWLSNQYVSVGVCDQKSTLGVPQEHLLICLLVCFWELGSRTETWNSTFRLGRMAKELPGCACLHAPSVRVINTFHCAWLFLCGFWGSNSGPYAWQ